MIWFQRFFPVFMLLTPVLFTLAIKTKTTGDRQILARGYERSLAWGTAILLALHALVILGLENSRLTTDTTLVTRRHPKSVRHVTRVNS